jgi:hypothetical protein
MTSKSSKLGYDGVIRAMSVKDQLGYCMDNGLEKEQGDDTGRYWEMGRKTTTAWNRATLCGKKVTAFTFDRSILLHILHQGTRRRTCITRLSQTPVF